MRKLSRYLLREISWLYVLGVAAFCLLLSIDMLTQWARFLIEQNASLATIGKLMLYRLPFFLHLSMPVAVVFAVLLATGRLAKDSELKAAYSLSVPPLRLLGPLLGFGLFISFATLVNNGYVEPLSEVAYERLVDSFFYTKPPAEVQTNVAYRVPEVGVYYAGRIRADTEDRNRAELSGILIISNDGTITTAPEGIWNSNKDVQTWTLSEAQVSKDGDDPQIETSLSFPFEIETEASESLVGGEQLTLIELWQRLVKARQVGGESRTLSYNFHSRVADAFSALIFALIAGALGLHVHGRSAGFAWTIVLLVVFWSVWTLSSNFYEQGVLSPIAAAWLTSGLVGFVGLVIAWRRLR